MLLIHELGVTVFLDSRHGHVKEAGKSIYRLISLLGSAPVNYHVKRQ